MPEVDELDPLGKDLAEERPVVLRSVGNLDQFKVRALAQYRLDLRSHHRLQRRLLLLGHARHAQRRRAALPSASHSDTDAQLASRYPPPSLPFIGAITPSSDTAIVHAASGMSSVASRTCASNCGRSSSQRADSALGNRSSKLFEGAMLPNASNTASASRGTRCAHSIAPLARRMRRPVPLDDAYPALQRRHRPLARSCPIQRSHRRHRAHRTQIGLLAPVHPAMLVPVDEHMRQVHVLALQRLARRRAFGVREQRVQLLLQRLEAKLARRLVALQQRLDAMRKCFEHGPDIGVGYQLVQVIRTRLRQAGEHASWTTLRRILEGQQRITATFHRADGRTLHVRKATRTEPPQQAIYDALGIHSAPGGIRKTVV